MSTTIDQKVVEMRFDNKQFESNVSTTMSTLDKLKQKLNLTGAAKGFDDIGRAAKRVDMSGLGRGVEQVGLKFNAMYTMADQALRNITNSVQRTATNMVKALTIDPVKTGFSEYETQINAVQTILANTSHNGTTIDQVNDALQLLNEYADKTIYNFTEMTRNIGTFTAAGVDLQTSVDSIQGIANLAAVSGSTSQQASTAMYQLSQALAAGKVSLMDWNSVVNAGMGGKVFQDALVRTSELLGTGAQGAIDMYGSFRESLTKGEWLTTEVLTETLKQFAGAYSEADLIAQGFTEQQAKDIAAMAKTAEEAATKVKTFTQLWDVLKESAQSGWSQTWKLLIGDYEQAKNLLSPLADVLIGFINKMSEARNKVLESALGKSFTAIFDKVKNGLKPVQQTADGIKEVVNSVKDYAEVVDEIIGGTWGSGQERWDKLAEAGYDWAHAQNLVNEKLGSSVRHATDYKEAQNGVADSQEKATESTSKYIAELAQMSREELKAMGYSSVQIAAFHELARAAEKTGIPLEEFIENIDQIDGRYLMVNSFKNAGDALVDTCKAIAEAWKKIFPPKSTEEKAQALFDMIAAFHKFTRGMSEAIYVDGKFTETGDKLIRTLKGVFAIVDLVTTVVGGGFKIGFKVLTSILEYFNLDILDLTANIGDAIVKFNDWVNGLFDVSGILDKIVPAIKNGGKAIKDWFSGLKEMKGVQSLIKSLERLFGGFKSFDLGGLSGIGKLIGGAFATVADAVKKLTGIDIGGIFNKIVSAFEKLTGIDLKPIGEFSFAGLIEGFASGASQVIDFIADLASNIVNKFCDLLGINSPSKVFIAIGGFIIAGLIAGITEGFTSVPGTFQELIARITNIFQNIDWGTVFAIGASVGGLVFMYKIANAFETFAGALENFSAPFGVFAEVSESIERVSKAMSTKLKTEALRNLAVTLAILVGCVVVLVKLGGEDPLKIWNAVAVVGAMAAVLFILSKAMTNMSKTSATFEKGKFNFEGVKSSLLTIAAAIGILALTVKLISTIPLKQAIGGFIGLGVLMGAVLGFVHILQKVTKGDISDNVDKMGGMMIKLGIAMLLMVGVCKLVGKLSPAEMIKGGIFALAFTQFVKSLVNTAKIHKQEQIAKIGGMLIAVAIAMGLMIGVCKLVSKLEPSEALAGAAFALAFTGFIKGLVKATKIGSDQQITKLGGLLLSLSISMTMLVGVCKLVGMLSTDDMIKGGIFALAFVAFVGILVQVTKIGSEQQIAKVGGTILALSIAVGILALVAMMLSLLKIESLIKGVAAVSVLGLVMAVMVKSLNGARDVKGSLIVMTAAIAVMAIAVAALTVIPFEKLGPAVAGMALLMGMFALMLKSLNGMYLGKETIGALVILTAIVGGLAFVVYKLSKEIRDPKGALINTVALSLLMLAMSGVLRILDTMKGTLTSGLSNVLLLTSMAGSLWVFAQVLKSMNDIEAAEKNVIVLVGLMYAMTGLLAILSLIGKTGLKALAGVGLLTAMWLPMIAFVDIIKRVSGIEIAKENVLILAGLMTLMTVLLGVLTIIGFGAPFALAGVLLLTAMWVPMMAFIDIIKRVSGVDMATENVIMLMYMMTIMTGLLTQLALVGPFALIGVAAMQGLIILMGEIAIFATAIGALMETFPSLEKFLNTGLPILEQLAGSIGTMIGKFIGGVGEGLGDSLVKIGDDIADFMLSLQEASVNAAGIEGTSFDGAKQLINVLQEIGTTTVGMTFADIFTFGGTSMERFKADGVAFFQAMKAISAEAESFTFPEGFSAEELKTLISAITSVGALTVGTSLADIFVNKIGDKTAMAKFQADGVAFFQAIKEIAPEMKGASLPEDFSIEGLTKLLDALKSVSTMMVGVSLADMFTKAVSKNGEGSGQTAMAKFQADGVAFFQAIKEISKAMVGASLPEDFSIEGLTKLLDALKSVGNRMIGLSIADMFAIGEDSSTAMAKFKTDGVAFFQAIKAISNEMVGFTMPEGFSKESLSKLFETLKSVGEYTVGASWGDLFTLGGTTIEKFQTDGVTFFRALKTMSTEASGINMTSITTSETAITKIKAIIASVNGIDYSGVEKFTGVGTGGFGADGPMHDIATALKDYGTTVAGLDLVAMNTSITAANKLKKLITSLVGLDTSGIENFKVKKIGTAMKDYNGQVKGIETSIIASSVTSAERLKKLITSLAGLDTSGVSLFNPKPIGEKMKSYSASVSAINAGAINNSINAANKLKNFISSLAGLNTSGVGSFKTAVESLGKIQVGNIEKTFSAAAKNLTSVGGQMITGIANGMKSKQTVLLSVSKGIVNQLVNSVRKSQTVFRTTGAALMSKLASGIASQRGATRTAISSAVSTAISSARGHYSSFYSAGGYLASGFAAGISANSYKAAAKARAMATAAKEAAEKALGINSPSRVFYQIGDYVGQGFTKALGDYNSKTYEAGSTMADYARQGLTNALSQIQDTIDSDLDTQPTIRPVLDLTNVRSGAAAIGGLFGNGVSVDTLANVNSIGSMVNSRIQNGSNSDVISAINKLGASLANVGGDTYLIDGVTYDDGSNISTAVKEIVREARIERRR